MTDKKKLTVLVDYGINNTPMILRVKGRLDATSAPTLQKKVFDLIGEESNNVLLDLNGLDYVSSAGLRILLMASREIRSLEGKLALCSLSKNVSELMRISGLDRYFEIKTTEEEALKLFHG